MTRASILRRARDEREIDQRASACIVGMIASCLCGALMGAGVVFAIGWGWL